MPLIGKIRDVYDDLPASERALAETLLEFPGDITVYSASELASRAKVSNAAVSRLMKRLGFADYREAQRAVRAAQASGQPIYLNTSLVEPQNMSRSLARQMEQDIRNLRVTYEQTDTLALSAAIAATVAARRVWCVGWRNSHFFAAYLRRQLVQTRSDVTLLPHPGQTAIEDLASATPEDVALVVGVRRRAALTDQVLAYLHDREVACAYFTDHRAVTAPRLATWTFRCQSRGVSLFDSYVAMISLMNHFCTEVVAESGERGRTQLARVEEALDFTGEILSGN